MVPKTLTDIVCATGVIGTIGALEDVNDVRHRVTLSPERSEEWRLRAIVTNAVEDKYQSSVLLIRASAAERAITVPPLSEELCHRM